MLFRTPRQVRLLAACLAALLLYAAPPVAASATTTPMSEHRKHPAPPATAVPNPDCTLIVPDNPLSAAGLATPYELQATNPRAGACHESNTAQSAFVQAAIYDPATHQIAIYNPLVVDRGAAPAAAPAPVTLPQGAIVAVWFGYNGDNLTLAGAASGTLQQSHCVNGLPGSVFTQFAYCNAVEFFHATNAAIRSSQLAVPATGTAVDGEPCPTVRDFFIVDQDQSDNLPTSYLVSAHGRLAQNTQVNRAAFPNATELGNPSDNRLLDEYVDGALRCSPWTVPDLTDPGALTAALALNELQARQYQQTPVALVPLGDPMAEDNGEPSRQKVNAYRLGVDQPVVNAEGDADTARYCREILRVAPGRLVLDQTLLSDAESPDPEAANSLYTFLAQRLVATYVNLDCQSLIRQADPVAVATDATGLAVSASVDQQLLKSILAALEPWQSQDEQADSAMRMH